MQPPATQATLAVATVGISEAARLAGVSRSTIHRSIKSGRLSATSKRGGGKSIDTSELERVFGALHIDAVATDATPPVATPELSHRIELLEVQIKAKDEQIAMLTATVDDLRERLDKASEQMDNMLGQKRLTWFDSLLGRK